MTTRLEGTVKFFNTTKGFGFNARADGEADVFVHESALDPDIGELDKGDRVSFEIKMVPKGPSAVLVKLVEDQVETVA